MFQYLTIWWRAPAFHLKNGIKLPSLQDLNRNDHQREQWRAITISWPHFLEQLNKLAKILFDHKSFEANIVKSCLHTYQYDQALSEGENIFNLILFIKKTTTLSNPPNGNKLTSAIFIQGLTERIEKSIESESLSDRHACSYTITLNFNNALQANQFLDALPGEDEVVSHSIINTNEVNKALTEPGYSLHTVANKSDISLGQTQGGYTAYRLAYKKHIVSDANRKKCKNSLCFKLVGGRYAWDLLLLKDLFNLLKTVEGLKALELYCTFYHGPIYDHFSADKNEIKHESNTGNAVSSIRHYALNDFTPEKVAYCYTHSDDA
jgi:hypothetical protein